MSTEQKPLSERKAAKFRDPERPGKWYLTDFTMEQVEARLAYLEAENARLTAPLSDEDLEREYGEAVEVVAKLVFGYEHLSINVFPPSQLARERLSEMEIIQQNLTRLHTALAEARGEIERLEAEKTELLEELDENSDLNCRATTVPSKEQP